MSTSFFLILPFLEFVTMNQINLVFAITNKFLTDFIFSISTDLETVSVSPAMVLHIYYTQVQGTLLKMM